MADPQPSVFDSDESLAARRVWSSALPLLANRLTRMTYESFVVTVRPLRLVDRCMELGVASHFAQEWLERRCDVIIRSVLEAVAGYSLEVVYRQVPPEEVELTPAPEPPHATCPEPPARVVRDEQALRELDGLYRELSTPLDPTLSFESFVVGKTNRLAYSAAVSVAEAPGMRFNPLFIYGSSGLGKTHLLHSIAHRILSADPSRRVLLMDGEIFTHSYVNAIRDRRFAPFRKLLRSVDVWLVDDIQCLAGKEHTREEFFHTFNALLQCRRQIVLTSDKTPRELHAMDERLRTRLEAGLIADIAPPGLETRLAILEQLCRAQGWDVPREVLEFIADAIQSNVRALSGAVTRLVVHSSVLQVPMDMELAQSVLNQFFIDKRPERNKAAVSLDQVVEAVAEHFALPAQALLSQKRDARTAYARQVAMYLARELCSESCKSIGAFLGGRDHTTVQRGAQKIESLIPHDPELRALILALRSRLCP